nr:protein G12-like [Megalopta genalis]
MKFVVAALVVLAAAGPLATAWKVPPAGSGALAKELQDFVDVLPVEKGVEIVRAYIAQDKQVQALLKIAGSPLSSALVKEVEAVPEFKQLANYIQKAGLDIYLLLNHLNKALKLDPIKPLSTYVVISGNGVSGLVKDLRAIIPYDKLHDLYIEKVGKSAVFKDFIVEVSSPKYQKLHEVIVNSQNLKSIALESKNAGVNPDDFPEGYSVLLTAHVVRNRA